MGKKAKAHRAKLEKRNRKIAQERYAMQNALQKMMNQMVEKQEAESLQVKVGDENVPFEFVAEPTETGIKGFESGSIVDFKESHPELLVADFDNDTEISVETNEVKTDQ
jgi:single-stranded DNA-specific DHH superfamily exonuclease